MADDRPPEVGWLHYRLAVAFCTAVVVGLMLLLFPILVLLASPNLEPLALYGYVFSKWGAAIILVASALGFAVGGERTANFFALIWGTHPFWSELESWLYEHGRTTILLGWTIVVLVVGFFWYSFR